MKRYLPATMVIFVMLMLAGCASHRYPYLNKNLAHEGWMRFVDADPNRWTAGSDNWFMTGDPNGTEIADQNAPYAAAISTMSVKVPEFVNIKSNGDFQVQLFGTYGPDSVYVYGPNDAVRSVIIEVRNNTLCISMAKNAPRSIRKVIIRIGVNQLSNLIQLGCGSIEGIQMHSAGLSVMSRGKGNIYLAGPMNLRRVDAINAGSVSVFGARTPVLDIRTGGAASVNVSGNVGVRSITHHGVGNVNIIGANTDGLRIYTDGKGKIGIRGQANVRMIKALDNTCVYICNSNSSGVYVWEGNNARVGMAGAADSLYVDTKNYSRFEGRNLCANNGFVRAHDASHINVTATNKLFAAATENGSVYFFGSPNMMSQFVSGLGVVIPIWSENASICPVETLAPVSYKGENISYKGENISYPSVNKPAPATTIPYDVPKPVVKEVPFKESKEKEPGYPHSSFKWVKKKLVGQD